MKLKNLENKAGFVLIEMIVTLLILALLLLPMGILIENERAKAKASNERYLAQDLAQELAEELSSGYDSGIVDTFNTRISSTYGYQADVPTPLVDIDKDGDGESDGKLIKITIKKKGNLQLAYLEFVI